MFKYRSIGIFESGILNVDTIQERSEILILNDGGLLDSGTNL